MQEGVSVEAFNITGDCDARLLSTMMPKVENTLSLGVDVAGTHRTSLAKTAKHGHLEECTFHQAKGSSFLLISFSAK